PESTLIIDEQLVAKPKYPAIDFHGHPPGLDGSAEGLARLGAAMDDIRLRVLIAASNMRGDRLRQALAGIRASPPMRDRVRVLTGIEFGKLERGWVQRSVRSIEA